jgi:hypothetical protein
MLTIHQIQKYNEEAKNAALDTFLKLNKTIDKNGNYLPMKLGIGNNSEVWIFYYPIQFDRIIIREVSGACCPLEYHKILSDKESCITYLKNLWDIIYVGLYQDPNNPDMITEIYKR